MSTWNTLTSHLDMESRWKRASPAQEVSIKTAETHLDHPFPPELTALLLETNGILDKADGTNVVWNLKRIKEDNTFLRTDPNMRELYMSFDSLLFFGDNGGGDQFGFARTGTGMDIFVWDHENDSRMWVASGLGPYLESVAKADGPDWFRGS